MSMQDISKSALRHLEKNCLMRNKSGGYSENAEGLFRRVSSAAAAADARYDSDADTEKTSAEFFELLTSLRFLPGSLTLLNAGRTDGQLASCFVLPVEDSMESIFDAVKNAAIIYKSGGNIGFSFSSLRKSGSEVHGSHGAAGGPIGFMSVFGAAAQAVKQENKPHGENLAVLRIDHPDIEKFIRCHEEVDGLQNFHTAVIITDEFLKAAENSEKFKLTDPNTGKASKRLKASELFVRLVDVMRRTGAPTVLFESAMHGEEAVAPCGEQPLMAYEASNIGSINLAKMLKREDELFVIDYDKLRETITTAVHFLDNIIDVNSYPFEKISHVTRQTRKIGLGVMGFADMLWQLGIPYNSDDAAELASSLMAFINAESHAASFDLAEKRGAYPTYLENAENNPLAMRNKIVTAIAPESVLSDICECAEGIEPRKSVLQNGKLHPLLVECLIAAKVYSSALEQLITDAGTLADIDSVPQDIKEVFVCADTASPISQLKLEAAFQKNTDGAVSKTIVFDANASAVDIADIFLRSHDTGCMMFKAKCLDTVDAPVQKNTRRLAQVTEIPRTALEVASSTTERFRSPCGTMTVTVSYDRLGVCEVYTHGCENCGCTAYLKATQRLADLALRSGVPPENVCTQLRGIKCEVAMSSPAMRGVSCPDAIASVIDRAAALSRTMQDEYVEPDPEETTTLAAPEEETPLTEDISAEELEAEAAIEAQETAAENISEHENQEAPEEALAEESAAEVEYPLPYEQPESAEPAEELPQNDEPLDDENTSPFKAITSEEIAEHLAAVEDDDEHSHKAQPALPAANSLKPILVTMTDEKNADAPQTLRRILTYNEDVSDSVFEDALLFGDLPDGIDDGDDGGQKAEHEVVAPQVLAPMTDFDDEQDDAEIEISELLENNFFESTDSAKLAQSIFESFAAIDSLDDETDESDELLLGNELSLDFGIDDEKPEEQQLDAPSDVENTDAPADVEGAKPDAEPAKDDSEAKEAAPNDRICAVCGSEADIVGNKIVCPVCGFTRTPL